MADEKPKEGVKTENNDHINLKVAGQDGSVVQFKIKRHTPLSKLMKAYCERQLEKFSVCPWSRSFSWMYF
uniref:Small ubiquitin like modifier 4 n=1 Tax=Pelusios castaneus TaxID=367368 RepID=A0A8C8SEL9_9SAUR